MIKGGAGVSLLRFLSGLTAETGDGAPGAAASQCKGENEIGR